MRYTRLNASNTVTSQYQIVAPASAATPDWVNFPGNTAWNTGGGLQLNPSAGVRRDSAGSRIGIMAASNFPGTAGNFPYAGTPAVAKVDYFKVTPDPITCETDAPTTSATLDPATPPTGDTYASSVKVNLSAADGGTGASGVATTEYRITKNGTAGNWTTLTNTASDNPFLNTVTVPDSGDYLVEYRSTDKAANTEAAKSVTFKIQLPVCDRSDEFDGHRSSCRAGSVTRATAARPTTGPLAPTVSGGQLHLPTNDLEIDAAAAATSLGPINFLGQDLPALGDNWRWRRSSPPATAAAGRTSAWSCGRRTATSSAPRSPTASALRQHLRRVVQGQPDGTTEGTRTDGRRQRPLLPNNIAVRSRSRCATRASALPTPSRPHYQVIAPASSRDADWVAFPAIDGDSWT